MGNYNALKNKQITEQYPVVADLYYDKLTLFKTELSFFLCKTAKDLLIIVNVKPPFPLKSI